jgi:23S rRNA (cytidine1920-2'-O)/16S rRNA (cytidine1409-2'-O)-methyltransferase
MKKRLDQYVVDLRLAPSRTKAKELIDTEKVEVFIGEKWQVITQASYLIQAEIKVRITDSNLLKYVSRSGLKLEEALLKFTMDCSGLEVLDLGQSAGGFTDCLLQRGASKVIGVDVASDELHEKLKQDSRVTALTQLNVKDMSANKILIGKKFPLIVVDVSFISLTKVLSTIATFLQPGGVLLALIKPQFELSRSDLDKHGIVKNNALVKQAVDSVTACAEKLNFKNIKIQSCSLKGRDGNQEFFLYSNL